ncbi:hypothetical protein MBLNU459_g1415t1 [Dothideomycetes sp. NU459]
MTRTVPQQKGAPGFLPEENENGTKSIIFSIKTSLLIPGLGPPSKDQTVVIKNSKIVHVGPSASLPAQYARAPTVDVPVLMPGLWDSHLHYLGVTSLNLDVYATTPQALAGARVAADVARTLNAGFTSVRELAGYGYLVSKAIGEGQLVGPNIYSAVSLLSQTAGHGDAHDTPLEVVRDLCNHGVPMTVTDGIAECRRAVRENIRKGAAVIKVAASGGVLSQLDDPHDQQFSDGELAVIVEEAERAGRIVAAHVHGKKGIMAALKAGCKTIEHGTWLDEEAVGLMKEKGAVLVATSLIVQEGVKHPELMSPESYIKMKQTAEAHEKAYKLAVESGVKIALGTDLGVSRPDNPLSHGNDGKELEWAVKAGMTPLHAIECATANGPLTLGARMAPLSGQIKEGYDADVIAIAANPLDDIKVLGDAKNVTHVWKGGRLYKSPALKCEIV